MVDRVRQLRLGGVHEDGLFGVLPAWVDGSKAPGTTSQMSELGFSATMRNIVTLRYFFLSPNLVWFSMACCMHLLFPYAIDQAMEWSEAWVLHRLALNLAVATGYYSFFYVSQHGPHALACNSPPGHPRFRHARAQVHPDSESPRRLADVGRRTKVADSAVFGHPGRSVLAWLGGAQVHTRELPHRGQHGAQPLLLEPRRSPVDCVGVCPAAGPKWPLCQCSSSDPVPPRGTTDAVTQLDNPTRRGRATELLPAALPPQSLPPPKAKAPMRRFHGLPPLQVLMRLWETGVVPYASDAEVLISLSPNLAP